MADDANATPRLSDSRDKHVRTAAACPSYEREKPKAERADVAAKPVDVEAGT